MRIREVSERLGVSEHTLRYYERIGLLGSIRKDAGGRRDYSQADLAWLEFIGRLKATAMSLDTIREYSRLREKGDATIPRRYGLLEAHGEVLERRIEELMRNKLALEDKMAIYRKAMESGRGA
jgi:DNA-binding transcriptional MerR regulator